MAESNFEYSTASGRLGAAGGLWKKHGASVKVVVGLGNPGQEYARTRHNIGFMVIERLKRELDAPVSRNRFKAEISEGRRKSLKLVLVAPQTFMNSSGDSVREVRNWHKLADSDLLVVYDDMDLPFGTLRMRARGSAGGHNGLKSISEQLGTQDIPRLRVGIGRSRSSSIGHVLSRFSAEEDRALPDLIERAAAAVFSWIDRGIITTMNEINVTPETLVSPES
jgi:PTH1 family peptidyl-tRNA hydrolase